MSTSPARRPLCTHPYEEMVWMVSCHADLLSAECRSSAQRSTMTCNRSECLTSAFAWVAETGHTPQRHPSPAFRQAVLA